MEKTDLELIAQSHAMLGTGQAKALRRSLDMSVQDLAASVGVSGASISRWENGLRTPHGDTAVRYAKVLDLLARVADKYTSRGGAGEAQS